MKLIVSLLHTPANTVPNALMAIVQNEFDYILDQTNQERRPDIMRKKVNNIQY